MQAYAICHGVTAKSNVTTDELGLGVLDSRARLASYQFHPVSDKSGKIHGPFEIVLANKSTSQNSMALFSYNFPEPGAASFKPASKSVLVTDRQRNLNMEPTKKPVIPIQELEEKYLRKKSRLTNEGTSQAETELDLFVRSVSDHLSAYISRMDQVQELLPKDGSTKADCGEVFNSQYSRDIRNVKFILKLVDSSGTSDSGNEADEKEDDLLLRISLEYAGDGRRPKQGCVKIKLDGSQKERYSDEDFEALEKQCEVFYTKTIAGAIKAAFVEE